MALKSFTITLLAILGVTQAAIGPVGKEGEFKVDPYYKKTLPFYDQADAECNFFNEKMNGGKNMTTTPWPEGCRVYSYNNSCNRYEISKDGKSVDSCEIKKQECNPARNFVGKCYEFFPENDPTQLRFPEEGKQCFFKESLYPITPWPRGCKIW